MADKPNILEWGRRGFLSMLVAGAATLTVGGGVGGAGERCIAIAGIAAIRHSSGKPGWPLPVFPARCDHREWLGNSGANEPWRLNWFAGKKAQTQFVTHCGRTNSRVVSRQPNTSSCLMNNSSGARATEQKRGGQDHAEVAR